MAVQTRFSKNEATAIVACMRDATDLIAQRESVYQVSKAVDDVVNKEIMVEVGVLPALAMALQEWKDPGVIYHVAVLVGDLASSVDEDEKVQFFELMVPHIESDFKLDEDISLATMLMYALYNLTKDDPIARQRLRDIPTFMQKLDALERVFNPSLSFEKFVKDMRSLSPSGTLTKAARAGSC